jgi:outer membrane scaffolding protein for murein synthesis (MipA/OmpV family)
MDDAHDWNSLSRTPSTPASPRRVSTPTPFALAFAASGLLALPGAAEAQEAAAEGASPKRGEWSVLLGGGAAVIPNYEGGDSLEVWPLPLVSITWRDRVFLDLSGLGVNVVRTDRFRAGVALGYARDRDEDEDARLRGLGDIDAAAQARAFARYAIGPAHLRASVSRDLGGTDGVQAELGAGITRSLSQTTSISIGAATTWANGAHMRGFFGVSPGQAARSGLPVYEAGAGFKRVDLNVGLVRTFGEAWLARVDAGAGYLIGDAADSPVVKERLQPLLAVGVGYRF